MWLDVGWPDRDPTQLFLESRDAWVHRGEDAVYRVGGSTPVHSFDLTFTDTQGPTYHGGNGLIRMSSRTVDSFYYSRMRLAVEGTIDRGEGPIAVTGNAWMDHQWGNFNPFVLIGWDWYSLQMDDGAELMFFVFRGDEDDPGVVDIASGTFVTPTGEQISLRKEDLKVEPLGDWTSPTTGATYPLDWRLAVPALDFDVTLSAMIEDAEMLNPMWNYWEGLVFIDGERAGEPVGGAGFVELSGYAGRPLFWWLFADQWPLSD
ncbi:MAG: carotenoid 1,2-hydratase [Deltaproteobacteria bacterium]|nr:carotenoid 1,2-hydratase [Deltaproteobacteria bacterium]